MICTCFEHSNLFKVNVTGRPRHLVKGTSDCYIGAVFIACPRADYYPRTSGGIVRPLKEKGFDTLNQKQCSSLNCLPPGRRQESNYELFNRNSGIEPRFPVTRCNHGRRITYHRKLIRQTFERCVAGSKAVRSAKVIQSHHSGREI